MTDPAPTRLERLLQAHHDGELSRFARWRFERRLRRSLALRRELAALGQLGGWLRETQPDAEADLWDRIALRLPAQDARRAEAASPARGPGRFAWPAAALVSLALAALVASRWIAPEPPEFEGVVRWLDSGGRGVIVLEGSPDTTIIWVFEGASDAATRGGLRDLV